MRDRQAGHAAPEDGDGLRGVRRRAAHRQGADTRSCPCRHDAGGMSWRVDAAMRGGFSETLVVGKCMSRVDGSRKTEPGQVCDEVHSLDSIMQGSASKGECCR